MQDGCVSIWRSTTTRWGLLCIALFSFTAWQVDLVPYETAWGNVASWVGAIATGAGLAFAGQSIRLQTMDQRNQKRQIIDDEDRRRDANARMVGLRAEWVRETVPAKFGRTEDEWRAKLTIQNGSPYPIRDIEIKLPNLDVDFPLLSDIVVRKPLSVSGLNATFTSLRIDAILSGERYVAEIAFRDLDYEADPYGAKIDRVLVGLEFTDPWNIQRKASTTAKR